MSVTEPNTFSKNIIEYLLQIQSFPEAEFVYDYVPTTYPVVPEVETGEATVPVTRTA